EALDGDVAHPAIGVHVEQAIERRPAEHPRVGIVPAAGARLPDALVGLVPVAAYVVADAAQQALRLAIEGAAVARELVGGVDDLAVDVELELLRGGVAGAHRARPAVAGE